MAIETIIQYTALAISSLIGLVVKNLYSRLDALETELQKKLNTQDYENDQTKLDASIKTLQQNVIDLPQRIITILKDTGNL